MTFVEPEKRVKSVEDVQKWERSEAYSDYLGFILAVSESIAGKKITDVSDPEPDTLPHRLISLLAKLSQWADEIEPEEQEQRFGNKAYRRWHQKLTENAETLLKELLPENHHPAIIELKTYLTDGFGNATRIDYGTGHEMAFVMFLAGLFKVEILNIKEHAPIIGLKVFDSYMKLCRKLQLRYRMEPAGSQGVWALDDYQFIPFVWGAAQLLKNAHVKPKSICDYEIAEMLAKEYHFFGCIKFISEVKSGPFAEHSNQLWNISAVVTWQKVHQGLIKMYRAEVLSKFPIIQHVFFGSLFSLEPSSNPVSEISIPSMQGRPGAHRVSTMPPPTITSMPPAHGDSK